MEKFDFNIEAANLKPPLQNVKRLELDNGLTLVIKEDNTIPLVAIFVWVKIGSLNETEEISGISHFLEHMLFKGTEKRAVGDLAKEIKGAGGYLNAFTSYDETCYFIVVPSSYLESGLESQADAFLYSSFDSRELEKETQVILEEIKSRDDHPEAIVWEKLMELAFKVHRYRHPIIGYETIINRFSRDNLVDYFNSYYKPENTILVVTGDVHEDKLQPLVKKYFGQFNGKSKKISVSTPEPEQKKLRFLNFQGDLAQKYVSLGFHIPKFLHEDSLAMEIISGILTDGKSSRLYQKIREDERLVTHISSGTLSGFDSGVFVISATLDDKAVLELLKSVFHELELLKYDPVSKREFERIKINMEKSFYHEMETVEGISRKLAEFEHLGDYRLIDQYLERLKKINEHDVIRAAQKYFTQENCNIVMYVPRTDKKEKKLDIKTVSTQLKNTSTSVRNEYNRKTANQVKRKKTIKTSDYNLSELSDGVTLVFKKRSSLPLVAMGAFLLGGMRYETTLNNGITNLTQRLMLKGTTNRTYKKLVREIDSIGGSIAPVIGKDVSGLFMNILSRNFKKGMDIFGDICFNAAYDHNQIEKEKEIICAQIRQENDNLMRLCLVNLYKILFKKHSYGLSLAGKEKTVKNFHREDLISWSQQYFVKNKIIISVIGDVSKKSVEKIVSEYFGTDERLAFQDKASTVAPFKGIRRKELKREKRQTSLAIGFRCPGVQHEDYFAISVMEEILSGMGGRLFINLRDRDYLGYIVHSYFDGSYDASAFWVYLGIPREREDEAVEKTFAELQLLKDVPVDSQELTDAKSAIIGNRLIDLQHNSALVLEYAKREMLDQRELGEKTFSERIHSITAEDIIRVANEYFTFDNHAISIIRPQ